MRTRQGTKSLTFLQPHLALHPFLHLQNSVLRKNIFLREVPIRVFHKYTCNKKQVQLTCLPPTSVAVHQHLFWVYYQVQVQFGNQLDPKDWGWKLVDNALEPLV